MYKNREIRPCRTCGRKILEPKVFCNPHCEKYQNMFKFNKKGGQYDNYYKSTVWTVVAGNKEHPTGTVMFS